MERLKGITWLRKSDPLFPASAAAV